jgi:hypothetical protein
VADGARVVIATADPRLRPRFRDWLSGWSWIRRLGAVFTIGAAVAGVTIGLIIQSEHQVPIPTPNPDPPSGGGTCDPLSTYDYGELYEACKTLALAQGRQIIVTDPATDFSCNTSLLAESHPQGVVTTGGWPVYIRIQFTPGHVSNVNGFNYDPGCQGDGDASTIDLVLEVDGDGVTYGVGVDAMKSRQSASATNGLQVTGYASCGPKVGAAHADGLQLQGGTRLDLYDMVLGATPDAFEAGYPHCQGAGGSYFMSGAGGFTPSNMKLIKSRVIGCNHAINGTQGMQGTSQITDVISRGFTSTGQWPSGACPGITAAVGACTGGPPFSGVTVTNLVCDNYPFT